MFTGMESKRKDSIHPLNNTLKYFDTYNEENWRKEEKRNWCTITYCTNIVHECKRIILIEDISLSRELTVDRDVPFFASLSLSLARSSNSCHPCFHRMEKRVAVHCYRRRRVCRCGGSLSFEFQSRIPVELLADFPWNGRIPGWNSRYSIYSAEKTEKRV